MKRKDLIFVVSLILLVIRTVYDLITETEYTPTLVFFAFVMMVILCCESCSKNMFNGEFYKWLNERI